MIPRIGTSATSSGAITPPTLWPNAKDVVEIDVIPAPKFQSYRRIRLQPADRPHEPASPSIFAPFTEMSTSPALSPAASAVNALLQTF
jgi:hypothetical protein